MSLHLLFATDSGLRDQQDILADMQKLASIAAQDNIDPYYRQVLNSEYQSRIDQIDRVSAQQSFAGIFLLDGSQDVCLEGVPGHGVLILHDLPEATVAALNLLDSNLATVKDALIALDRLKNALDLVAAFRYQQKQAWWQLVQ